MRVVTVPCLLDNYAYLLCDGDRALVVDPGEAAPVEAALAREGLELVGVLATHHHHDHVGGIAGLAGARALEVVAFEGESRVPHRTQGVGRERARTSFEVSGFALEALHVPAHTTGAVAYLWGEHLFTGDTLFRAGAGRLFEGTPSDLFESLTRLASLPPTTRVWCGHEYTAKNLAFAKHALSLGAPDARPHKAVERIDAELHAASELVRAGQPTVGAPLEVELATNPFLLALGDDGLARRLGAHTRLQALASLRRARDSW
jgi:hydroxyacylglutathione hydrolase